MMTAIRQRARSSAQKAERRDAILDAAAEAFADRPFEQVSLSALASRAGLSKAALYRYFRNKEVLFLALYQRELARLGQMGEQTDWRAGVAIGLTRMLVAQPLYCSLSAILHTILERHLEQSEARAFKEELYEHFEYLGRLLATQLNVPPASAMDLLLQVQEALVGCWHLSHPAPVVERVIDEGPLRVFRLDFEQRLRAHIEALVWTIEERHCV